MVRVLAGQGAREDVEELTADVFLALWAHAGELNPEQGLRPWLGTVALYIGLSNLIGVFGLTPPTKDISVTAALALMSMFLIYGAQFRYNGLAGGLKKFAEPMPLLIPINLMEVAIRPLALCMRLFGNILGAFIIMEMLKLLVPVVLPAVFSLYFDLFDGLIQTVVFVFLTTLFTGEGIKEED